MSDIPFHRLWQPADAGQRRPIQLRWVAPGRPAESPSCKQRK
jgi:hypothetical protein